MPQQPSPTTNPAFLAHSPLRRSLDDLIGITAREGYHFDVGKVQRLARKGRHLPHTAHTE